jgi:hypothetical protein
MNQDARKMQYGRLNFSRTLHTVNRSDCVMITVPLISSVHATISRGSIRGHQKTSIPIPPNKGNFTHFLIGKFITYW